jgi:SAM-dependent methyltransferase
MDRAAPSAGPDREATLNPAHYLSDDYFQLESLFSMVHQLREIRQFRPRRVLEIGVGNGFVSTLLRQAGIEVVTADINPALRPDVCCALHDLPAALAGETFDLVSCCEVLEHMPFEVFDDSLRTLRSLAPRAFITLPGHFPWMGLTGRLGIHNRFISMALGLRIPVRRRLSEGHCWEIHSEWRTRRSALRRRMLAHFARVDCGVFAMHRYHYYFRCHA